MIDASALVAYARREAGYDVVAGRLRSAERVLVSAVNWAEAAAKLRDYAMTPAVLRQALAAVDARILPFTEADADAVARLAARLRPLGLSLGDRACLALGFEAGVPVLTADRAWDRVDLPELVVEQIR